MDEALRYLGAAGDAGDTRRQVKGMAALLEARIAPRYVWRVIDAQTVSDGILLPGADLLLSGSLARRMLAGCRQAALLICTLGAGFDAMLRTWQARDMAGAAVLDACTDFVSAPTSAVILLTIGYDLVFRDIPWKETWKAVALRLFIMLALRAAFAVLLRAFWPDSGLSDAANIMFILPAPFVLPVFADDENQRVYVSSVLSVSTLVAVAGFALLAALRGF